MVTTNLRAGYIRKNGAPYSDKARVTEYFDLNTAPNGDRWLTVTTKVEDPVYFTRPYLTSSDFKHLADRRRLVAVAVLGTVSTLLRVFRPAWLRGGPSAFATLRRTVRSACKERSK